MQTAPQYKRRLSRPWLWPHKLLARFTDPIPSGLWLANVFFQRILAVNNEIPWMVHFTSRVVGDVSIGKNVWISFAVSGGCYIQGGNGIFIGDGTIFAPGVKIISANHSLKSLSEWEACSPVKIGKKCWLGSNVCILPGVQLGDNVTVGAGSVVTKSFPSRSVIAGVPASIVKVSHGVEV